MLSIVREPAMTYATAEDKLYGEVIDLAESADETTTDDELPFPAEVPDEDAVFDTLLDADEDADEDADPGTASTTALTTKVPLGSVLVRQANTDGIFCVTDTLGVTSTGGTPLTLPVQRLVTSLP